MAAGEPPQPIDRPERRLDVRAELWNGQAQEDAGARIIRHDRESVRHTVQHRAATELEDTVLKREIHGGGGGSAGKKSGQAR